MKPIWFVVFKYFRTLIFANNSPGKHPFKQLLVHVFVIIAQFEFDSRCQSFTARRGPVVHLADLVVTRSIIVCAARPSSASRYNQRRAVKWILGKQDHHYNNDIEAKRARPDANEAEI